MLSHVFVSEVQREEHPRKVFAVSVITALYPSGLKTAVRDQAKYEGVEKGLNQFTIIMNRSRIEW